MVRTLRESERFTSRRNFYDSEYFAGTNCRNQSIFYYLLSKRPFQNKQNFKEEPGICVCCPSRHLSPSFFQHLAFPTLLSEPSFIQSWNGSAWKLPGTLNTQCVVPVAVMALSYITAINVGIKTLAVCIICQIIGAYLGPRFVEVTRENDQTVCRHRIGHCCILNFYGTNGGFPQTEQPVNCMAEN